MIKMHINCIKLDILIVGILGTSRFVLMLVICGVCVSYLLRNTEIFVLFCGIS